MHIIPKAGIAVTAAVAAILATGGGVAQADPAVERAVASALARAADRAAAQADAERDRRAAGNWSPYTRQASAIPPIGPLLPPPARHRAPARYRHLARVNGGNRSFAQLELLYGHPRSHRDARDMAWNRVRTAYPTLRTPDRRFRGPVLIWVRG